MSQSAIHPEYPEEAKGRFTWEKGSLKQASSSPPHLAFKPLWEAMSRTIF